ncbi:chemotaxis protein CheB [Thalassorhabdomicrobium marinisediminis]|uniref:chemotaxis protein CheB n=1 Tax=Thalassorhabdomicrobium marinisediminis TaxID=2170577 RepID=UPI002493755B|nr:chemotaxis protein CheB [Thalassorhabdomicrobium marinisediminis]
MKDAADPDLTIVAIGSSAGGLEAIREFVSSLPATSPVCFVVVQHMSPHHKSIMSQLVGRETDLLVEDITDGVIPRANVIYITPPKADVVIEGGRLRLKPPSDTLSTPKPSVDRFLLTLAAERGANTVAIILSGTGSDGAYGVQAIREAGGITIAQDRDTAKYDGMPQSAIQTGCVDLVLAPADIGTHLQKILAANHDFSGFRTDTLGEPPFADVLQMLLARTRVDFREYKQSTVQRRIERRMTALGVDDLHAYTRVLRTRPAELDTLFKDLLISVTRFFRDGSEFGHLERLLPEVITAADGGPLRVWVAGCATGEEAYSIAMLLAEALGGLTSDFKDKVQIFATDIDIDALAVAQRGIYSSGALANIPEALAKKYLVPDADGVRVINHLRSAILFSKHNLCQDPPFQRIHLLCCRNVLIYFGKSLQKKVMARFHYAMTPDALLFLGTSETISGSEELFAKDSTTPHIFRRRQIARGVAADYAMPAVRPVTPPEIRRAPRADTESNDRKMFNALMQSLGENSFLVTAEGTILQVNGSISAFIEVTENSRLRMHIDLLRSPLREEARSLVMIALRNRERRSGIVQRGMGPDGADLRLAVYPVVAEAINEQLALVVFNTVESAAKLRDGSGDSTGDSTGDVTGDGTGRAVAESRIFELEAEVAVTREALQQTIEELETTNEELQSVNEEMQSTNEELEATNEMLETSNEELQSSNEELITVNEELQMTASTLTGRTGELTSILHNTPLAILVTDSALQITQATDAACEVFTIPRPINQVHISQVSVPQGYPSLAALCSDALQAGKPVEQEFSSHGTQIKMSCAPYFDDFGKTLGLTLVVTQFPGLALEMEMILSNTRIHLFNRAQDGTILRISEASANVLGLSRDDAVGENLFDLIPPEAVDSVRQNDAKVLAGEDQTTPETVLFRDSDPEDPSYLAIERHRYIDPVTQEPTVYTMAMDVTEIVTATGHTKATIERFRHLQELAGFGYWELDPVNKTIFWSSKVFDIHGIPESAGPPDYDTAINFYHPDDLPMISEKVAKAMKPGGEFRFEARLIRADGEEVRVRSYAIAVTDRTGEVTKIVGAYEKL